MQLEAMSEARRSAAVATCLEWVKALAVLGGTSCPTYPGSTDPWGKIQSPIQRKFTAQQRAWGRHVQSVLEMCLFEKALFRRHVYGFNCYRFYFQMFSSATWVCPCASQCASVRVSVSVSEHVRVRPCLCCARAYAYVCLCACVGVGVCVSLLLCPSAGLGSPFPPLSSHPSPFPPICAVFAAVNTLSLMGALSTFAGAFDSVGVQVGADVDFLTGVEVHRILD